ncbi:Copine-5 [Mortierella antarctica]|nr:Copine-5 [Mortierella antarctica]
MMHAAPVAMMPPPPTSKVELKIRCKKLVNRDATSYSDPQVFLFLEDRHTGQWSKTAHAMTERIKDSLNPVFVKGLEMDYRFETVQRLKFVVYDIDDKHSGKFSDQDFQGEATCDLGSIIGARGGQLALNLVHPRFNTSGNQGRGTIIIRAEELSASKRVLNFSIRANDLTKKGLFKSPPSAFLVIQRANDNGTFSPVYKSNVVTSNDDPIWKPFSIKEVNLCNGDPNRPLKIEVMSHKSSGTHTVLGTTAVFTAADLSRRSFPHAMAIPPMTGSSVLTIQSFSVTEPPTFMDFLAGGGTLGLCVAIDFTQSNGDPKSPQSLHFKNPTGENDYTRAIRSVGNILQCYDTDKLIPAYGFGGRLGGQVSHAFPLNGNPNNPEVYGVDGLLAAYWHALTFAELWGPTNFAPVISAATDIAKQCEKHIGGYTVLLILTDGAITDMNETVKAIRTASKHPMSIIIVGVGRAQFTSMNVLDGDDGDATMFKKSRDIVQFVAACDYLPNNEHGLAAALLAELPDQFISYMTINNIKPPPPIRVETMAIPIVGAPGVMPTPGAPGAPPIPTMPTMPPTHATPVPQPQAGQYPPAAAHPGHYAPPSPYAPPTGIPAHPVAYAPQPAAPSGSPHLAPYGATAVPPAARPASPSGSPLLGQYAPPVGPPPPQPAPAGSPSLAHHQHPATSQPYAGGVYPPQAPHPHGAYPQQPYPYGTTPGHQAPYYPPQHGAYPGYPPQQPGYPPQQPGYPPQQPGYPPAGQPPYPGQPSYPGHSPQPQHQQPVYPGYPPQPNYGYPAPAHAPPGSAPAPGAPVPPPAHGAAEIKPTSKAADSLAASVADMSIASTAPATVSSASQPPRVGAPQALPSSGEGAK